ncbi:MAG: glycerophosphodiester phosphodiesterase family protein [Spirochaetes bacterium]|nr:glycerophosphodiester phosphodiesterase family protein [Spirochaetota bacterium]
MAKRLAGFIILIIALFFLFVAVLLLLNPSGKRKEICRNHGIPFGAVIAHRGASYYAPEETEPAYLLARDMGADYLEVDVQRTKDGVLVALHDDTLERTTNVASVFPGREKDPIETFTFAEVRRLDAGSWFNAKYPHKARPKFAGVKILSLEEVLRIAKGGVHKPGVYIEIKSPKRFPNIVQQLVNMLERLGWTIGGDETHTANGIVRVGTSRGRIILQSFDPDCVAEFVHFAPQIPRVYLYGSDDVETMGWKAIINTARRLSAGCGPSGYVATPFKNKNAHDARLFVHVYTINKRWQAQLISLFGADGFFTDRPDMMLEFYGRIPSDTIENILTKHGY